jgi:hypothetical protein
MRPKRNLKNHCNNKTPAFIGGLFLFAPTDEITEQECQLFSPISPARMQAEIEQRTWCGPSNLA